MSRLLFTEEGFEDFLALQKDNKKSFKKLKALIKDISRNGAEHGLGKPEALKHELSGYYSRQIDEKNRLLYKVNNDIIEIYSCKGHYEDK